MKFKISTVIILILALGVIYFIYGSEPELKIDQLSAPSSFSRFSFKSGLDLAGGTQLLYRADLSGVKVDNTKTSMESLRDVIERRINIFGVSETNVQVQQGNFLNKEEHRLIIDLPGITDIDQAVKMIGQTPLLEFKTEDPNFNPDKAQEVTVGEDGNLILDVGDLFIDTELTGKYLKKAQLEFDQLTGKPIVSISFDKEGADLFQQITKENVGKMVAIYLDGSPMSTPVVNEEIKGGEAQITGDFTAEEAKKLVGRLNSGALPVPIELLSTQIIGPSLGEKAIQTGINAGLIGFLIIALFFITWYRLPGLVAVVALVIYITIMLALFKLVPVTLTAAGIAGFIISIGIAVDANILIFERVKEELRNGRTIIDSVKIGFERAWLSIRDSNLSSIISAVILFWFSTSLIKGFALTFGIGVLVSMFSAITISRVFLLALDTRKENKLLRSLFSSGFIK